MMKQQYGQKDINLLVNTPVQTVLLDKMPTKEALEKLSKDLKLINK